MLKGGSQLIAVIGQNDAFQSDPYNLSYCWELDGDELMYFVRVKRDTILAADGNTETRRTSDTAQHGNS